MFARSVSLVLIAAIVACPLWCGNGLWYADSCRAAERASDAAGPDHRGCCCCPQHSVPESDEPAPGEFPGQSECQGVCGGAVFEKRNELNGGDSFSVPLRDVEAPSVPGLVERRADVSEHRGYCRGWNHGRALRTAHMSFLC